MATDIAYSRTMGLLRTRTALVVAGSVAHACCRESSGATTSGKTRSARGWACICAASIAGMARMQHERSQSLPPRPMVSRSCPAAACCPVAAQASLRPSAPAASPIGRRSDGWSGVWSAALAEARGLADGPGAWVRPSLLDPVGQRMVNSVANITEIDDGHAAARLPALGLDTLPNHAGHAGDGAALHRAALGPRRGRFDKLLERFVCLDCLDHPGAALPFSVVKVAASQIGKGLQLAHFYLLVGAITGQCLIRQGVEVVFAYPGGASMPIHQALTRVSGRLRTILP